MVRGTRSVSWVGAARKGFEAFPQGVRLKLARALCLVAEGRRPDIAKLLDGSGPGVLELTLHHRDSITQLPQSVRVTRRVRDQYDRPLEITDLMVEAQQDALVYEFTLPAAG